MRRLLLILFTFSTIATGAVLPFGSSFSGPYAKNIDGVVNLIRKICRDEEVDTAFNETEGSGDGQSTDVLRLLHKIRKHFEAVKGKSDLRDRIRDLRTENIVLSYEIEKLPIGNESHTSTIDKNSKYEELFHNLEKAVIEFLSLDKNEDERRIQLVEDHMNSAEVLLEMEKLFKFGGIVRAKLLWNKYSDHVFNLCYRLAKNQAIVITVASSIKQIMLNPSALEDPEAYQKILTDVKEQYQHFLNIIAQNNKEREEIGFQFKELFTDDEMSQFGKQVELPHSTLQNNFILDKETEILGPKYFYITAKYCNGSHMVNDNTQAVTLTKDYCTYLVIRSQNKGKELVFYDQQVVASKFRKIVLAEQKNHESWNKAKEELADSGLMAVVISKDMRHDDDVYTVPGGYKLTVNIHVVERKQHCNYYQRPYGCEESHQTIPVTVTGYFLYGNQGSPAVKKL